MSGAACTVAADVGNTAIKLAVRKEDSILDHAVSLDAEGWERDVIAWIDDRVACDRRNWSIASVHRSATERLVREIDRSAVPSVVRVIRHHDVPMPIDVDHPQRLGIDRLLGAFAARKRFQSAIILVDAGSAITVDWVCPEGIYGGGVILPGLRLQSQALARGTDALPEINWDNDSVISTPSRNTVDAIRNGILASVIGGIDSLIDRYLDGAGILSEQTAIVLTGGDAATLGRYLRHRHDHIPNLVCRGLLELP